MAGGCRGRGYIILKAFLKNSRIIFGILLILCFLFCPGISAFANELENTPECGDINGDGCIDINDAILLLQYIVDIKRPDEEVKGRADVYEDGKIDVNDVITILRYVVNDPAVDSCLLYTSRCV